MCWGVKQLDAVSELTSLFCPKIRCREQLNDRHPFKRQDTYTVKSYASLPTARRQQFYIVWTSTAASNLSLAFHPR